VYPDSVSIGTSLIGRKQFVEQVVCLVHPGEQLGALLGKPVESSFGVTGRDQPSAEVVVLPGPFLGGGDLFFEVDQCCVESPVRTNRIGELNINTMRCKNTPALSGPIHASGSDPCSTVAPFGIFIHHDSGNNPMLASRIVSGASVINTVVYRLIQRTCPV
jgi:hypothetical protein